MIIVLVTVPKDNAEELAKKILENRLAACINISEVKSLFWENNRIVNAEEALLIIKTRDELYDKLEDFVKKNHPYKIPEILAISVSDGNAEYLRWVDKETKQRFYPK